jgi:hypothetical protein
VDGDVGVAQQAAQFDAQLIDSVVRRSGAPIRLIREIAGAWIPQQV